MINGLLNLYFRIYQKIFENIKNIAIEESREMIVMLRTLRIGNFKCWKDTGNIQMAPITLFFGTNSSGKSSIGQFLMMLRQTVDSPDRKAVLFPGDQYSAVKLGSYRDIVHRHDVNKEIEISYTWDLASPFTIKDSGNNKSFSGSLLGFGVRISLNDADSRTLVVDWLKYSMAKTDWVFNISMVRRPKPKSDYDINVDEFQLTRNRGRVWPIKAPVRFYGFPEEVVAYYQNADFVQKLNLEHEKLFRSIFYLGPLRNKAERLYPWTGINPEHVGYSGENAIAAMLSAKKRELSLGKRKRYKPFEVIIAKELKKLDLIDGFQVNRISKQRQEYEVKIKAKGFADWVDLPDVGFGVSQVIPVLVQCFYAPANSIIIMEQPEIHLHPSAQAALADVFIDVINSRENRKNRNIQLIIETHSEHFLRRLQRRIAEEKISQDDVAAYFLKVGRSATKLEPLQIDLFGNITNWPENFFGDEMGDITAQAEAAMERKIRLSKENGESNDG